VNDEVNVAVSAMNDVAIVAASAMNDVAIESRDLLTTIMTKTKNNNFLSYVENGAMAKSLIVPAAAVAVGRLFDYCRSSLLCRWWPACRLSLSCKRIVVWRRRNNSRKQRNEIRTLISRTICSRISHQTAKNLLV
jgi:hypothetical protein